MEETVRRVLVCVVGSDETADDLARARELGRLIAAEGWVVVTGGRPAGVMEAACAGAKEVDGSVTVGILPSRDADLSPYVDIPIVTDVHNARNNINVLTGAVTVACGARGAGTVSEIALAMKNARPVILLACGELAERFFATIGSFHRVETPAEAVQIVRRVIEGAATPASRRP